MVRWAVKHWVMVFVSVLAFIALGWVAFSNLNVDLLPKIEMPVVTVITIYPGASPYEVEEYVTRKIEDAVALCDNVDNIKSISAENMSVVMVEFKWGTDMEYATFDVREKVDRVKDELPDDAEEPYLMRVSFSSVMPVAFLSLSGEVDEGYLRWLAEDVLSKKVVELEGVANVAVIGGLRREVHVVLRNEDLAKYAIPFTRVITAIKMNNLTYPAGSLIFGDKRYRVRTYSEVTSLEDLAMIPVGRSSRKLVRLSDVAQIEDSYKERSSYARIGFKPTVFLMVYKQADANTVKVCGRIRELVPELKKIVPPGLKLSMVFGFDERIEEILSNLRSEAVEGSLLAMLIIFLFLTSIRSTLVVAVSIPLSVIAAFVGLYFMGLSFNMVTIGGLALAIGRIVDDSIVVIEAITRHFSKGKDARSAAVEGTEEVWMAIAASTFTTIAVFVPIFFLPGLARQFFTGFSVVMIVGLLASLMVAALVVPPLASFTLSIGGEHRERENVVTKFVSWLQRVYKGMLAGGLRVRALMVLIAVIVFIASLMGLRNIGKDFLPETNLPIVIIRMSTPPGSSLEATYKKVIQVEKELYDVAVKHADVEFVFSMAGSEKESQAFLLLMGGVTGGDEFGEVELKLSKKDRNKRPIIIKEVRERIKDIPGVTVDFVHPFKAITGQAGVKPIEVVIKGPNVDTLWQIGNSLKRQLETIPGVYDVDLSWKRGAPELKVEVDRRRAALYGLSSMEVAYLLQALTKGVEVTKLRRKGHEYDIRVMLPKPKDEYQLMNTYLVPQASMKPLRLRDVAVLREDRAPSVITREDRMRVIKVVANKDTDVSLSEVLKAIRRRIDKMGLPIGYTYQFEGEEKQRKETFQGLGVAMIFGIFLIYAVLASQFNSLTLPLVIMLSIPLELVGAYLGLVVFKQTLNMMSMMGLLMVTGIVVSNAVLLVDYTDQLRASGKERTEALVEAGAIRLKPILMTTLSTAISMIPLALGLREGGELFRPLAAVVIGGLSTSTLLTLFIVPAFYTYMDDLERRLLKRDRFSR